MPVLSGLHLSQLSVIVYDWDDPTLNDNAVRHVGTNPRCCQDLALSASSTSHCRFTTSRRFTSNDSALITTLSHRLSWIATAALLPHLFHTVNWKFIGSFLTPESRASSTTVAVIPLMKTLHQAQPDYTWSIVAVLAAGRFPNTLTGTVPR